ncbi:type II toxin-antitoxin system VapC family toxin [Candidatus Accumulibacter sp. ACC005]|jgi:predicted nucleic acid-binding protein|uniref:type II toxin-antitoxin system VapC family toxin n=1 Tax=Candidatus Accumulibacter sp. ACC005 TaxID=2823331 RepID=UPI0025C5650A|nr:type II toxin-antitoxin system VapC family toxin [Candidatus Accumulibacter sp. ACC005]
MSYLLDTNVLSELRRKRPNVGVVEWCARRPAATLFLSVLTFGELRKGVEGLAASDRRSALLDWLEEELPTFFSGRILPVDSHVADCWGRLMAAAGRPIPAIDSLIGATAAQHRLRLVTRNVRDYADLGLEVINPWSE